ncbi:MAG TPA: hypothetical protein DDW85_10320 [Porphyromonadaceae bacterium]|nr:hypothetical protein [Porphyromonadaceae bacterium]
MGILKRILFVCFFSIFSFLAYSQDSDNTEFWFVAPDAAFHHSDRPTFLMIATGSEPATVTISMPQNKYFKETRADTTTIMPANSSWKFNFTGAQVDSVENAYTSSGIVTKKGIHITSTAPVSAYYQIDGGNQKEIFTFKGKKALGKEFYMPFQAIYRIADNSSYKDQQFRQIQIVATENDTKIVIHPKSEKSVFKTATSTINSKSSEADRTKILNKGETLLWRENVRNTDDLTGTRITSDKPIAVTHFEDCVQDLTNTDRDPIGDQLVPVNNLGQNYIVVKGYSSANATDHVLILAVADGTTDVWIGHKGKKEELITSLKKGEYIAYDLGLGNAEPGAYFISTTQSVYCMHQSAADGGELGGAILPSLYAISGRSITFMQRQSGFNSMFLVFRDAAKSGFTLDGKPLPKHTVSDVGFGDWRYAKVSLPTSGGEKVSTVANSTGSFALGYFNGGSGTSLYGYLSAFGRFSFAGDTLYICGDNYTFDTPYAKKYTWTLPDSTTSNDSTFVTKKSGRYILEVNQDPFIVKDTTYLKLQNFNHILSAPEQLLVDKSFNFKIVLNPQKDPDNYFKKKYEWKFGEGASVATSDKDSVTVSYSSSGLKTISLKIWNEDAKCDSTVTRQINVLEASAGKVMYWRTDARNRDWNNVHNWSKTYLPKDSILLIPSKDTRVIMTSNAVNYPSLKDGKEHTDWSRYGQPEVNEIVFRYGSELYYQHLLKYNKAYINYNWGYYDGNLVAGQPTDSWENGIKLSRDTWHILAAPLKSIASGDFALAGYPFSWQKKFNVRQPDGSSVAEGDFSLPFETNDIKLETVNNAIAVKMAGFDANTIGYKDHKYLQNLHGVIEIPYFENNSEKEYYPWHNYDALSKISYFYYFDTNTLKLLNTPVGAMGRTGEAYRFVYETTDNQIPTDKIYKMRLNKDDEIGKNKEVMVGNPLFAPIDAKAFADENRTTIDETKGYKFLSDDGQTWEQHQEFAEGGKIPAWKAFIVTLKDGAVDVSFPLEGIALTKSLSASSISYKTKSLTADNTLSVQLLKEGFASGEPAVLRNNQYGNSADIRKMILPEGHAVPEVFFIDSEKGVANLIQNYRQGQKEVPIGVKTSDVHSRLSLQFKNVPMFTATTGVKAVLVDKYLNIKQDLARNATYGFNQRAVGLDKQSVDKTRFVLRLGNESRVTPDSDNGIAVVYRSGVLQVTANETIEAVTIYDSQGRMVYSPHSVGLAEYTHPITLKGGIFVVQVKTVSGKSKAEKITGY